MAMLVENCWKKASDVSVTCIELTDFHVRSASYSCSAAAKVAIYQGYSFGLDQEGRKEAKEVRFH